MDSAAMSLRQHIRQNMRLALPLMIGQLATIGIWPSDTIAMGWIGSSSLAAGVWGGLLLGLSVASLILTMRMMRAMRRIRDGDRILLA